MPTPLSSVMMTTSPSAFCRMYSQMLPTPPLGLDAVENGVFRQRLQRKAGDQAFAQLLIGDIGDLDGDGPAVAVLRALLARAIFSESIPA